MTDSSYIVPFIVLGFMGTEGGIVAAYEAKSRRDIGWPSLWTHWIIFFLYLAVTLGITLTVSWNNKLLPPIFGGSSDVQTRAEDVVYPFDPAPPNSTSATIIAIHALNPTLASVVNGCLIFSVLSAANTAIYYSSRTLWGHTYNLKGQHVLSRWFRSLSVLMDNGAPGRAIGITAVLFCWIPFLQLGESLSIDQVCSTQSRPSLARQRRAAANRPPRLAGPRSSLNLIKYELLVGVVSATCGFLTLQELARCPSYLDTALFHN